MLTLSKYYKALNGSISQIKSVIDSQSVWDEERQSPFNHNKCGIINFEKHPCELSHYSSNCRAQTLNSAHVLCIYYKTGWNLQNMSPLLSPNLYTDEFHNWEFLCKRGCAHPFQNMYMTFSWILSNSLLKHGNQRCLTRPQLECTSALEFTGRCKHPSLEPLWRRQLRNDLLFFSEEFIIFHFLPLAKLLPMPLPIDLETTHIH